MSATAASFKAGSVDPTVEFIGHGNDGLKRSYPAKWFRSQSNRSHIILIGLNIIFSIGLIILLIQSQRNHCEALLVEPAPKMCQLLDSRPSLSVGKENSTSAMLISSDDRKSLAAFTGYLEFFHRNKEAIKEREKFQVLKLQSVDWFHANKHIGKGYNLCHYFEENPNSADCVTQRGLKLATDCATMNLLYHKNEKLNEWAIDSFVLSYDAGFDANSNKRLIGSCRPNSMGQLDFPTQHHYSCTRGIVLDCLESDGFYRNKDPLHVKLWIEELMFELNGNVDFIKDGRFSKNPSTCTVLAASGESK